MTHLRSDRWYKLGRTLLYGRLEDEKPFNTVRRLVQYEDYVLRLMPRAGLPVPEPYGFVEITPEREYLLVTEFFAAPGGRRRRGRRGVIDDGLRIVRQLWEAGLAHRDIKPANLLVRDGPAAADRLGVRRGPAEPVAAGRRPRQHDAGPGAAQRCPDGLRPGPAAVLRQRDRGGVRRDPRADHAVAAAPDDPRAGPRPARRVHPAAAGTVAADPHPALDRPPGRAAGSASSCCAVLASQLVIELLRSPL